MSTHPFCHLNRRIGLGLLVVGLAALLQLGGCGGGSDMTPPDDTDQPAQQVEEPVSGESAAAANGRAKSSIQRK